MRSSELDDPGDKRAPLLRIAPTILAPQPVRPSIISPTPNILSRASISERWTPTPPISYQMSYPEHLKETNSLGLTGVFTKPLSIITPALTGQELTPRDATPMGSSMSNQYIVTSPTNFNLGQRMSWDHQNHEKNVYDCSSENNNNKDHLLTLAIASHRYQRLSTTNSNNSSASCHGHTSRSSSGIPLCQHNVPLVEQASSPTGAFDSSSSSPTSSYNSSSLSPVDSTAPSSVGSRPPSDLPVTKSLSPITCAGQADYLPGEDFSFMTDPAYYEYLMKSTMAGGDVDKGKLQRSISVAQSMASQYPMEL